MKNVATLTQQKRSLFIAMGMLVLIFFACAFYLNIHESVKTLGTVVIENYRKSIQSPLSGAIRSIHVKNGDFVRKGDLLVQLSDEEEEVRLNQLQMKLGTLFSKHDRLQSEVKDRKTIQFSTDIPPFMQNENIQANRIKESEIFNSKRVAWNAYRKNVARQLSQLRNENLGFQEQGAEKKQQLDLISEEVKDLASLFSKGMTPKSRYFALKRRKSEILEQASALKTRQRQIKDKVQEIAAAYEQAAAERIADLHLKINDTMAEITLQQEQHKILQTNSAKRTLLSPVDGRVFNMGALHAGYVVKPVEILMQIVPHNERLAIDSKVTDQKILKIATGMNVRIFPQAANRLFDDPVTGIVKHISGDALPDAATGNNQYALRITPQQKNTRLMPGMSVDLYLLADKVSLLEYILRPILKRLNIE